MTLDIDTRVRALAHTPVLLVATDFDGTISPIVPKPDEARPHGRCIDALTALAKLPHTHAAIISGRARADLRARTGEPAGVTLIGSHGAEWPGQTPRPSDPAVLHALRNALTRIAGHAPGLSVESKPLSCALHFRQAEPHDAHSAIDQVLRGPAQLPGVQVRHGSMVVELLLSGATKGDALRTLRHLHGATGVAFLGDDRTDEDAIAALGPTDLGVKVGSDPSVTPLRVAGCDDVERILLDLARERANWLSQRRLHPIQNHSILSDQRTLAVVDDHARLVWLCLPRADSSPIFASLLGGESAGVFSISPASAAGPPTQRYDQSSFVLVSSWNDLTVTDYLDCSGGRAYQRAGRSDLLRVVSGSGTVRIRFAPRADFGRMGTRLRRHPSGLEVEGHPDPLVLHSPGVHWEIADDGQHHTAEAVVSLTHRTGPLVLELRSGIASLNDPFADESTRRATTRQFWSGWSSTLRLPRLHEHAVRRSALVLKALCYGPTGAFFAAATTSLPEHLGGTRNWDYRFCWPRDAALAAAALLRLGNTGHALKLLDWLLAVVDTLESPDRLRPIYTVSGRNLPPEGEIPGLSGYGDSKPIRISNAAANQVQLDVFGPIVDLVALLVRSGAPVSPDHWRLVRAMVEAVAVRWQEPDHGIWEIRADKRHHVHSKVMCWLCVDRGLEVRQHVLGRSDPEWERLRDQIRDDVLAHGYHKDRRAFTTAYGSDQLDAAALTVGLCGMLPPDDPRFVSTVEVVSRDLRVGPAVYRYVHDDGLPGREGGMLICAGWLAESLALIGRYAEARDLLDALVAQTGPTGIASEQYCPEHAIALGNLAQAYSHLAIIQAAAGGGGGSAAEEAT